VADDGRAVIFGRDADGYEDARPSYPAAATDHILGLAKGPDVVEVGAGTGKATESIARSGIELTCLEPSSEMAALLEAKSLPGVSVVVGRFEDWDGPPESVDLIYAAQAWHWVDRDRGFHRALSLLRPGGALALMWNIPVDRYGRHEDSYTRHAPHLLTEHDERIERRDNHDWAADMDAAGFTGTARFTHSWSEFLTSERYRRLYSTYSDHMMLEEPTRRLLLDELAAAVEGWGGTAEVRYRTEVFTGRKPLPGRR
jgi:SAM-dependent methyltransferase